MRGTWQTTDSGGGGLVLIAVIVAAAVLGSGAASAAVSALEVIAIITGAVIALAILGVIAWLIYRARSAPARSDRPGARLTARPVSRIGSAAPPELSSGHKPAIGPPRHENHFRDIGPGREVHYHFHVSAAELAAIMRRYDGGDRPPR